jgi:tetratricopeptide (TPR) repeat protein
MAGIGKTTLALHWAHQVAARFPDGQLYVNLRGFDQSDAPVAPAEAIRGFLDALGVEPTRVPVDLAAQAALYRSLLAGRRVLVVLDNARDADQVRPLLPGSEACLVVVTSRNQLPGLAASAGARPITLGLLSVAEAGDLLAGHLGADRVAAEPRAAGELIGLCGRLPLALSAAAARAAARPGFPLAVLATELRDARARLDKLDAGDPATSMRTVLSWSCHHLEPAAAAMFPLLGVHPGPDISAPAAASLAGVPPRHAREALEALTRAHLLTEHVPGRFAMHDLVRAYAAEQASTASSRSALRRVLDHYLHTAHAAALLLMPTREPLTLARPGRGVQPAEHAGLEQALGWLGAEFAVLVAAVAEAAAAGLASYSWQICWTLEDFARWQGYVHDYLAAQRIALGAAQREGDRAGQAQAHLGLGFYLALYGHGPMSDTRAHLLCALDLFTELGDRVGQALAYDRHARSLTVDYSRSVQDRHAAALDLTQRALNLWRELDRPAWQGRALNGIGWCYARLGKPQQAIGYCEQALSLLKGHGDLWAESATWDSLGYAHYRLGHHAQAAACYQRAYELSINYDGQAEVLLHIGDLHNATGDQDAARSAWQKALAIMDDLHRPDIERARARLRGCPPADDYR